MSDNKNLIQKLRNYANQFDKTGDTQIAKDLSDAADLIDQLYVANSSLHRYTMVIAKEPKGSTEEMSKPKLYDWDSIYERKTDKGYGDPELTAYDNARFFIECCMKEEGVGVDNAECPEDEIDFWLTNQPFTILFDEDGRFVTKEPKNT